MKALNLKSLAVAMTFLVAFSGDVVFSSQEPIRRLKLYDAQENYLMFVNFEYDSTGKDTGYSVYFSDSTFTRRVVTARNSDNLLIKETALNFTEDTVFNSTFTPKGDKTDITVLDQFKVDQFHDVVSYSKTDALNFDFVQNGSTINKMKYEYDNHGRLSSVNIYDNAGILIYYGQIETDVGVLSPKFNRSIPRPSISLKGDDVLAWKFTLDRASKVKCEAISLLGRRVAVLFSGTLPGGKHSKLLRLGSSFSLTNGAYVAVMSIDDKPVARTKFIVQGIHGGVK